jgi:peptidase E
MSTVPQPKSRKPSAVVLLGAQRFDSTLGAVVRDLHCPGPIALITTGWREREDEDERIRAHLECETINLRLYHRGDEVFAEDPELHQIHRAKQAKLRHKQDFYRIRLDHELAANHVIRQRHAPADVLAEEEGASVAAIRSLDAYHLAQCQRISAEFDATVRLRERPSIVRHREQIAEALSRCKGIAIAGGHVAALINRMRLFGIEDLIDGQAVFAWSGGGMAISERIVLFHDYPPQGRGAAEILDEGLGLVRNVVVLPHPETRLRMHDPERVSLLARRFDPAHCLALPHGAHVIVQDDKFGKSADVIRLLPDGSCPPFEDQAA